MKETSKSIARLAARFLSGELKTLTRKQQLSVCASCVSQAEREQESVKAWGIERRNGQLLGFTFNTNKGARAAKEFSEIVIPVEIRRVRPAQAEAGEGMNVPEKLAREIARVTELRGQYASLDGMPGVNVKPLMFLIDQSLEVAKKAAGENDALTQIAALKTLEGFEK